MNEHEMELYSLLMSQGKEEEASKLLADINQADWESLGEQ